MRDLLDLASIVEGSGAPALLSLASESDDAKSRLLDDLTKILGPQYSEEEVIAAATRSPVIAVSTIVAVLAGKRFVNALSVRLSKLVELELSGAGDTEIINVSRALGTPVEASPRGCMLEEDAFVDDRGFVGRICYRYRMKLCHYLMAAKTLLAEPSWKLVSYPVHRGYVYIRDRGRVVRLVAERYKNVVHEKLLALASSTEALEILKGFASRWKVIAEAIDALRSAVASYVTSAPKQGSSSSVRYIAQGPALENVSSVDELAELSSKFFPPCIRKLVNSLLGGENLSHHERFALATFLINAGVDLDIILDLFRHAPDFNERIARYQIEHLAGLRGSRKKYLPYSCSTMKTLGICPGDECGVKNPIVYLYRAIRSSRKGRRRSERAESVGAS